VLRRRDVDEFIELKRQGLSVRAISRLTGYGRTTISRYLSGPTSRPVYGPRTSAESICKGCCPHYNIPIAFEVVPYRNRQKWALPQAA
jgi:transposase